MLHSPGSCWSPLEGSLEDSPQLLLLLHGPPRLCSMARHRMAWHGIRMAWHEMAQHSIEWHRMAQDGQAQHGVVQCRRLSLLALRTGGFPAGCRFAAWCKAAGDQGSCLQAPREGRGSSALPSPPSSPALGLGRFLRARGTGLLFLGGPKENGRNFPPIECPIVSAVVIIRFC